MHFDGIQFPWAWYLQTASRAAISVAAVTATPFVGDVRGRFVGAPPNFNAAYIVHDRNSRIECIEISTQLHRHADTATCLSADAMCRRIFSAHVAGMQTSYTPNFDRRRRRRARRHVGCLEFINNTAPPVLPGNRDAMLLLLLLPLLRPCRTAGHLCPGCTS